MCSVFELIRETRTSHPQVCVRALQALLDMLQGQTPEALKLEPEEGIGELRSGSKFNRFLIFIFSLCF